MKPAFQGRLTAIFLRIGNFTFGGGDPTMAALYKELVASRGWLSQEAYGLIYALARITPGTNVLAFGAGAAWKIGGWRAAVLAVAAMSVPSAVLVVWLTQGYVALQSNAYALAAIGGTLAAAVGLMATGAWQLLAPQFASRNWRRILYAGALALAALLGLQAGLAPVWILGLAAVAGFLWEGPRQ